MTQISSLLKTAESNLDASLERLFKLLEIPSISTDRAYDAQCQKAGQYVTQMLQEIGFEATLHTTPGQPIVLAHYHVENEAPHILFYGHYDVQPVDPLDKWHSDPFQPFLDVDDKGVKRIRARGATDDKGQLMTFVEALRIWISQTGSLPFNVTILIEGEEESGSPSLCPFLEAHREALKADIAMVCDTNMWNEKTPAITTRLRGMVHDEVTIHGPDIDLHSGLFGGAAVNPIHVLCDILAKLRNEDGSISLPGFYDGVTPVPDKTYAQWMDLGVTPENYLGHLGLNHASGEKGRHVLEQIWSRPTLEINGIYGGYMGEGTKTVIPASATAKISFRLVGTQDPDKLIASFRSFIEANLPPDCDVEFSKHPHGSPALEVSEDNPHLIKTARALEKEFDVPTVLMGMGGSIPIVRHFRDIIGMESVLVGFGLNDDAIHSPNEKYNLESFRRGIRSWVRIIGELANS